MSKLKYPLFLKTVSSPRAEDGDEAPPSGLVLEAPADGSVLVEGVRIGMGCSLKVIRTACESLGLSARGSKRENMAST